MDYNPLPYTRDKLTDQEKDAWSVLKWLFIYLSLIGVGTLIAMWIVK